MGDPPQLSMASLLAAGSALGREYAELLTSSGSIEAIWGNRAEWVGERESLRDCLCEPCESPSPWDGELCTRELLLRRGDGRCEWVEVESRQLSEGLLVWARPLALAPLERLSHVARLGLGGSLLGPMSHELNNMVQGIGAATYLIRDNTENGDPVDAQDLEQLEAIGRQLAALAAQLHLVLGYEASRVQLMDPVAVLRQQTLPLLEQCGVSRTLELAVDLPSEAPAVRWPKAELEFVLAALVGNAAQAAIGTTEGPELILSTQSDEDGLCIEIINRLGEADGRVRSAPFGSGRNSQRHLGLGLSAAMAIVYTLGGELIQEAHPVGVRTRLRLRSVADEP